MMNSKITSIVAAVGLFAAAASNAAYPEKPIRLIVPFAAGGPTDVVARSLADSMSRALGKTVFVENKAGAGGGVGTGQLVRAPADGYTLAVAAVSTHVVNPVCNSNAGYDPVNDFTPIAQVADMPMVWVMQPSMPEKDFKDVVETAKKEPAQLTQGTPGICSLGHMIVEKINHRLGTKIRNVPYQGSAPAVTDFMGKNLSLMFDVEQLIIPLITTNKAKPIAVMWPSRLKSLPNVPTLDELGYKDLNMRPWYGIVAPKGLPAEITKTLVDAVATAMEDPKLRTQFSSAGMSPITGVNGADFAKKIKFEYEDTKAFAAKVQLTK